MIVGTPWRSGIIDNDATGTTAVKTRASKSSHVGLWRLNNTNNDSLIGFLWLTYDLLVPDKSCQQCLCEDYSI